ncbi:scavenger receptor cysteine-rich domain superfamily protein-like [Anneissia japonica]|uniref:scavenger receptor cysteine-rich domain superfamily protein-like n=1 Tax=Anneissia japonica TaxID=1529436 RepID=UPI001425B86B|nr:scavenger receptor cysteine-rich domain superfamily protein-like [Anneissia japonica]
MFTGFSVRLADGASVYEGRLEIYYNGEWGTVCDDRWDYEDAHVVCRELGYGNPVRTLISTGYQGSLQSILLDDVDCIGWESSLSSCSHSTIGVHDCTHSEDVALECSSDLSTELSIRLADGPSSSQGRLEVYYGGEWGTVCDDGWGDAEARVACHQLGYGYPVRTLISSIYQGAYDQSIFLDDVDCIGWESSLSSCSHSTIGVEDCSHTEDVAIECSSVRLVDGINENIGRLEILDGGVWVQACKGYWTNTNSDVACRELGYDGAETLIDGDNIPASSGSTSSWYTFECNGYESRLLDCTHYLYNYCYYEEVKLQCTDGYGAQGDVRFYGGYNGDKGTLEAYLYGTWGTVCSDNWNNDASDVVCRQLGYDRAEEGWDNSYSYDGAYKTIHTFTIECTGEESHLNDCYFNTDDTAIGCTNGVALTCVQAGLSGFVIAAIIVGIIVVGCVLVCVFYHCCKQKTPLPSNAVATSNPPVTNVSLQVQNNGYQPSPIYPSAPPSSWPSAPPPTYNSVVNNPNPSAYIAPYPVETPPPAFIPFQPPLNQGVDQTTYGGAEMHNNIPGVNVLYNPPPLTK